jgi:sugar phosphate isomerase/epimerase
MEDHDMKTEQIAAQLYTLRDFCRTPAEIAKTLKLVRSIGYQSVQVSGMGPIDPKELRRMLDGEGLVCCATHESPADLFTAPQSVVDKLAILGCRIAGFPSPMDEDLASMDTLTAFARRLNSTGEFLSKAEITLVYHNHHREFRRIEGRLILDIIYSETDPSFLQGEIDTYWVQYGGADPVDWCRKLKNRLPIIHLKDYAISPSFEPADAEIGYGNLDWPNIITASEESGCEWFAVEQDVSPCDPFESLEMSFRYIKENLVSG